MPVAKRLTAVDTGPGLPGSGWARRGRGGPVGIALVSGLGGALVIGLLAAVAPPIFAVFVATLIFGAVLLTRPLLLLWLTTLATLVVAGSVKFFLPSFERAWWAAYALAGGTLFAALLHMVSAQKRRHPHAAGDVGPALRVLLLLFVAVMLAMGIAHAVSLAQFAAAAKSWLLYAGLVVLLAVVPFSANDIRKWSMALLAIACVQVIPVVYQFIFVRGRRIELGIGSGASTADSVVGTFGGSMEAGGLSATMALFISVALAGVLVLRQRHLISRKITAALVFALAVPLALAEVKIAFVYVVILMLLIYRRSILRNPLGFLAGSLVVALTLGAALVLYQEFHWGKNGRSLRENVEHSFGYSFEKTPTNIDKYRAGLMTRREAVEFWASSHGLSNPVHTLFGHGFGAARTSGIVVGQAAAENWPRRIDTTGITSLLWEFGLFGAGLFVAALFAAAGACGRLAKAVRLPVWQQALAGSLQVLFILTFVSLPYRNDVPYAAPMMFLLMAGFGLVFWLGRQASRGRVMASPRA